MQTLSQVLELPVLADAFACDDELLLLALSARLDPSAPLPHTEALHAEALFERLPLDALWRAVSSSLSALTAGGGGAGGGAAASGRTSGDDLATISLVDRSMRFLRQMGGPHDATTGHEAYGVAQLCQLGESACAVAAAVLARVLGGGDGAQWAVLRAALLLFSNVLTLANAQRPPSPREPPPSAPRPPPSRSPSVGRLSPSIDAEPMRHLSRADDDGAFLDLGADGGSIADGIGVTTTGGGGDAGASVGPSDELTALLGPLMAAFAPLLASLIEWCCQQPAPLGAQPRNTLFLAASILASMLTREPPPAPLPLPPPSPTATVAAPDGDTVVGGDTASSIASFPATDATNAAAAPHLSEGFLRALTGGGSATALARPPFPFEMAASMEAPFSSISAPPVLWETQDDVGFLRLTKLLADDEPPLGAEDGAASSSSAASGAAASGGELPVWARALLRGATQSSQFEVASCCALTLAHVLAAPRADGVIDAATPAGGGAGQRRRRRRRRRRHRRRGRRTLRRRRHPPRAISRRRASRGCYARCGRSSATPTAACSTRRPSCGSRSSACGPPSAARSSRSSSAARRRSPTTPRSSRT